MSALIVPIDVAALSVGSEDVDKFALVAHDFAELPYLDPSLDTHNRSASIASKVTPAPNTPSELRPGVHLHWALPDGLTRGVTDGNGDVGFPVTPNRWLVVRIPSAPGPPLTAWILESDRLWGPQRPVGNGNSRVLPVWPPSADGMPAPAPAGSPYRQMGRAFNFTEWVGSSAEPGDYAHPRLRTAVGYGTPEYAASYAHSPNVFGICDSLEGITAEKGLAYAIVGWYADLAEDPLHGVSSKAEILERLGWTFDGEALPEHIVCNGIVHGISWSRDGANLPERQGKISVAIGNTTAEAVAALVAARHPDLPELETLLDYLQLGLLGKLDEPGGMSEVEPARHQAGFSSRTGGTVWVVKPTDADSAVLGPELAHDLHQLNDIQHTYDAMAFEVRSRRERIYSDWCKYMSLLYGEALEIADDEFGPECRICRHASSSHGGERHLGRCRCTGCTCPSFAGIGHEDVYRFLAGQRSRPVSGDLATLRARRKELADTAAVVAEKKRAVQDALPSDRVRLVAVDAPRFWAPNDPVVVLAGDLVRSSPRYGGDGTLRCRLSAQLATELAVGTYSVTANDLPALPDSAAPLPAETGALIAEAFFFDPGRAGLLATIARTTVAAAESAQQGLLAGPLAPSPVGRNEQGEQPWIPLLLQWTALFSPASPVGAGTTTAVYDAGTLSDHYVLDDATVDLAPRFGPGRDLGAAQAYTGTALLSGRTDINLRAQIDRYCNHNPDHPQNDELRRLVDRLGLERTMAQTLAGFNSGLLMQMQTLQLPVGDPLARTAGTLAFRFDQEVRAAVGDANDAIPSPDLFFNPIRAGLLELGRLTIIDAFGQRFTPELDLVVAESMRAQDTSSRPVLLPPRLAQPSRLLFRWLSADDDDVEIDDRLASTPICGWLLFNHLDASLMVYNAAGAAIGSLALDRSADAKDSEPPAWRPPPGSDIEPALDDLNPHLRDFLRDVASRGQDFLVKFLDVLDAASTNIHPGNASDAANLGLLISRPFALVRASLRLELEGLPALEESWEAFDAAIVADEHNQRSCAGITGVAVPVRLGDLGSPNDGLVGYFRDDADEAARTFYSHAADSDSDSGVVTPTLLSVTPMASTDQASPLALTLLVDPRGSVRARTGILPTKEISIPAQFYAASLERMQVTFLATPLLSGPEALELPLPRVPGYHWSWTAKDGETWKTVALDGANDSQSPQRVVEGWFTLQGEK